MFLNSSIDIAFRFYIIRYMNIPVQPFQSNIPSGNKLSILSNNEIAPRIILIIAVSGSFHGNILIYG